MLRPVADKFKIASPYGVRTHPVTNELNSFHKGVDFACPVGTPVVACFDGTILSIKSKHDENPAGNRLWLYCGTHRAGYFHLDDDGVRVKPDQRVKAGELLAFSGATGRVSGPHLHFQLENLKTLHHEQPIFEEQNLG